MLNKTIFFETNNIYAQDGSVDEYELGKACSIHIQGRVINTFQEVSLDMTTVVSPLEKISVPTTPALSYIHLKDSQYTVVGYVYKKRGIYAFMDIGDFCIFLCKDAKNLEEGKFYIATVDFIYDIWDCYNVEMHDTHDEDLELEGIIQSIFVDTSRYIQAEDKKVWTKENVDSKYDISLEKTACWDDEEYSNGSVDYLIEISIKVEDKELWKCH